MQLSKEDQETTTNFELDISKTLFSNIFFFVGAIISTIWIYTFNTMINTFTLPEMKIIALFVWAYSTIKIIHLMSDSINFEYKERPKIKEVKTNE